MLAAHGLLHTCKGKGDLLDASKGLCSPDADRASHVVQGTQRRRCRSKCTCQGSSLHTAIWLEGPTRQGS